MINVILRGIDTEQLCWRRVANCATVIPSFDTAVAIPPRFKRGRHLFVDAETLNSLLSNPNVRVRNVHTESF
jgi:hypothetical protein